MDIRRLGYFLAVVEHGSVTEAAAALHVAQPSLSQSIRALERELGVTLFDRQRRRLTLTADGKALLDPAHRIIEDLAAARAAVRRVDGPAAGSLDLAVHDLLAVGLAGVIAGFLADARRRQPELVLRMHGPRDEDELVRLVVEGRCELGVTYLPLHHPGLRVRPLGRQQVMLVMPADRAGHPDPVPLAALAGMPLVDSVKGFTAGRAAIRAALREHRVALRPVVRSAHREAIVPLVLAGAGIAFVSERYGHDAARRGATVRRLDPPIDVGYGLLFRDGAISPAGRRLARRLEAACTGAAAT